MITTEHPPPFPNPNLTTRTTSPSLAPPPTCGHAALRAMVQKASKSCRFRPRTSATAARSAGSARAMLSRSLTTIASIVATPSTWVG